MRPRLIQTDKLKDDNKAEKEMLEFLKELSEGYTIYRELQVNRAFEDKVYGMEKGQPDFVVVGADIGLLSIEVKDWNLTLNQYTWRDQYKVVKKAVKDASEKVIDSPVAQADVYRHAFMELTRDIRIFVTSIVAFPRLSRSEFLNKIGNIDHLKNPQSRFFLDLDTVIFKEDLDEFFTKPEVLFTRIVRKHSNFRPATVEQTQQVNERLLPNSFRIGDLAKRQQNREKLRMITQQQEKWIFDLNRSTSYLLDVAGSGKTNALVSRAIHIIEQHHKQKQPLPNVLLTTYNPNLQRNIERILEGKIKPEERHTRYRTLRVENIEYIMERIALTGYGIKSKKEYHELNNPGSSDYSKTLRDDVRTALQDNLDTFRIFDYILIDEIQDFDDEQLYLIRKLARKENFFFVGDIGQKIYDRYHDLKRHGFNVAELDLPKTYKMYRTPRYIGELAYHFIMSDSSIRSEFETYGYRADTEFASHNENAASLLRVSSPIDAVVERIQDLLATHYTEDDIMVITSPQKGPLHAKAFTNAGLRFSVGQPKSASEISLVDYMNVKGLEREVVFVTGVEDLYHASKPDAMFQNPAAQLKEERFSRRKIYVALTRAIEECIVFYTDPSNKFISELVTINRKITTKRQRAN
jgi:superfamily I DNA/RNA helicase